MATAHPHAEATYSILARDDRSYAIEVVIPGTHPTMVTGFSTKRAAEDWVASHKRSVADFPLSRRPFMRSRTHAKRE